MTLPRVEQAEYAAQQASPWLPINQVFRVLDAFAFRTSVTDRNLSTPPVSCPDGARYLVATSATAEWTGQENHIAIAVGTNASNGWYFVDARVEGTEIYVADEDIEIVWNGSQYAIANDQGTPFDLPVACSAQAGETLALGTPFEFEWPFNSEMEEIHGFLRVASASGDIVEVSVRKNGVAVFTNDFITFDSGERTSRTAATQPNLTTTSFLKGDIVSIDILQAGDSPLGLIVTFSGRRTGT